MRGPKLQIEVEVTERKTLLIKMLIKTLTQILLIPTGHHLIRKYTGLLNKSISVSQMFKTLTGRFKCRILDQALNLR